MSQIINDDMLVKGNFETLGTMNISGDLTVGNGIAGTDCVLTFDGETSDGVITWMEDEDYFQFSDDILMLTDERIQFRDTDIYINSNADTFLDLTADGAIRLNQTASDTNVDLQFIKVIIL